MENYANLSHYNINSRQNLELLLNFSIGNIFFLTGVANTVRLMKCMIGTIEVHCWHSFVKFSFLHAQIADTGLTPCTGVSLVIFSDDQ